MTELFRIITYIKFDPNDIADCKVWLDASDLEGLDGDQISSWTNKGEADFDLIQPNTTYQPTLKVGIINSKNAIRFNGTNQFFYNANGLDLFKNVGFVSVFVVYKVTTQVQQYILMASDGLVGGRYPRFGIYNSVAMMVTAAKQLDGNPEYEFFGNYIEKTFNTFHIQNGDVSWAGNFIKSYVDGYANGELLDIQSSGNTSNTNSINISCGVGEFSTPQITLYPSSSLLPRSPSYYNGDIAEIIIYNRQLTILEKEKLNRYLTIKYGIYYMQLAPNTNLYPATDLFLPW